MAQIAIKINENSLNMAKFSSKVENGHILAIWGMEMAWPLLKFSSGQPFLENGHICHKWPELATLSTDINSNWVNLS